MSVRYIPVQCKTACHKIKNDGLPYSWDLNVYRGCFHDCKYCFARYSHQYLENEHNFSKDVYVKTNIAEQLERQLASKSWKGQMVNLGGVTDNYQPIEAHYRIMPDLLRLLIKYKNPAGILTKSDLPLRDFDLIDELSRVAYVNIASTITVADDRLQRLIEPGATSSTRRFAMLKEFRKTNASVGVFMMPIMPYLTDDPDMIDLHFSKTKACGAHYLLTTTLHLRSKQTRKTYLNFIKYEFPRLYEKTCALYKKGYAPETYRKQLYQTVHQLKIKHGLTSRYTKASALPAIQPDLFD